MSWTLRVPRLDRAASLLDVAHEAGRVLPRDEARVAQQLVLGALTSGRASTAGDLLDELDAASPAERRRMLDEARVAAGLPTTARADADTATAARSRALNAVAPDGMFPAVCAHAGCTETPLNAVGVPTTSDVRRWWCPTHVDQAAPGDMQPRPSGLAWGPNGVIDLREQEIERERAEAEAERCRLHREQREAERAAELQPLKGHDAAIAEHFTPSGAGWPT